MRWSRLDSCFHECCISELAWGGGGDSRLEAFRLTHKCSMCREILGIRTFSTSTLPHEVILLLPSPRSGFTHMPINSGCAIIVNWEVLHNILTSPKDWAVCDKESDGKITGMCGITLGVISLPPLLVCILCDLSNRVSSSSNIFTIACWIKSMAHLIQHPILTVTNQMLMRCTKAGAEPNSTPSTCDSQPLVFRGVLSRLEETEYSHQVVSWHLCGNTIGQPSSTWCPPDVLHNPVLQRLT